MAVKAAGATPARPGSVTRRALLGAGVIGGAGIAARALLLRSSLAPAASPPAAGDWSSPLGRESARVLQLLRRATFGATPEQLLAAQSDGFARTLDRLLETPPAAPPAASAGRARGRIQAWWLNHMLTTPTPFAERMTLFWHGHFTSDLTKVNLRFPFLYWQNLTWRANALGDFRQFLYAVTIDPAMLRYLDLGTSTGDAPNENYSREVMELFTMGAGSYSEDDVRALARALAGWRIPRPTGGDPKVGVFDPRRAYRGGPLTFLGRTAAFDTRSALDRILAQPVTAPFVVGKVLAHFLMPQPPAATVTRLAEAFVKSGWSVKQLMHDVFSSEEFASPSAYRSLVKQPVEFAVQAMRALGVTDVRPAVLAGPPMGQELFNPPDVAGWPLNGEWISSSTMLARVNFLGSLLSAGALPPSRTAHLDQIDGVLSQATAAALGRAGTDLERWTAVLASPEFQLK